MRFEVSNNITVIDPDETALAPVLKNLVLQNPDYYKLERMGKWTGGTPKTICLYERAGNELWLPFGLLQTLWAMFPNACVWETKFLPLRQYNYMSGIELYPYQQKAKAAVLEKRNGVLIMPCGSGKTQTGLDVIAEIGGRALWLTHTQDLLRQSMKRAQEVFDCPSESFGTITAGKVNIGESLTLATVQTMSRLDLLAYSRVWDIVIVDECQHCAGSPTKVTQFYKAVSNLSARYKIGLTATLHRSDGLERAVTALLGGVIYEVMREDVGEKTCPVRVEWIQTGFSPDIDAVTRGDGTMDYQALIRNLTEDRGRLSVVVNRINAIPKGEPVMVLANRIDYLNELRARYRGKSVQLSGQKPTKKNKQERKAALRKLNDGELDAIFATYQLAAEGLDIPNLRYVVFATPEKNKTTVVQSAGRVGRAAEGKEYGTVIDFTDDFPMYYGWQKMRAGYYKELTSC